jgi:2-keto-4-pentenoate hydratase/2-oxohepta-3-ene-1,7-dioic acid hydratase in catechol pathway
MRLVSFDTGAGARAALLRDGRVFDIWGDAFAHVRGDDRTVYALLQGGLLHEVEAVEEEGVPVEGVELLPPIARPNKIVCIGLNYRSHAEEQGAEPPETPTFFAKFANALAPPVGTVALPSWTETVDYEAEVAFVIGSRCKEVSEGRAMDHVAGYMLFNDLSARDYQFKTPQWMPGKVFDGAAPCGPALVTADEAGAHDAIEIELRLNGEVMQRASTADLVHSIPALVAYLSRLMTLEPGDVISTGTPAGVGSMRDPNVWLKPGDEVVVTSPQLGELVTSLR